MNKSILPIALIILALGAIIFTLSKNKKTIDASNKSIDRSEIPIAVSVSGVCIGTLDINQQYPATLKAFDEANVTSQTSGIISSLNIELGQQISKGQLLGKLDTRILDINLKSAQTNLSAAEVNLKTAQTAKEKTLDDYNRAKDLFDHKAGTEVNMINTKNSYENALNNYDNAKNSYDNAKNQIELTKQQIANTQIVAPLNGIISAKSVKFGEFINPGTPIAVITNVSPIKASAFVDQSIVYQLKIGQEGIITSPIFGLKKLSGKIIFINPKADANHNYQIDLLINNNQGIALKAGTDVSVQFNTLSKHNALLIPKSALVLDRQEPYVFVVQDNKAIGKSIQIGAFQGDNVEVLSGLTIGESVITNGQINLREGSNITIVK